MEYSNAYISEMLEFTSYRDAPQLDYWKTSKCDSNLWMIDPDITKRPTSCDRMKKNNN